MSSSLFMLVLLSTILLCSARAANKTPEPKESALTKDPENDNHMYQHMIFPADERTLPAKYFGPDYIWDTKGFPRRVEEVEQDKKNKKKST